MGATIGLKVVVMMLLRSTFYSGYYRKKPAASNIMNVILECWSLGLSIGTVTTRFAQLLVVTAFYVGRIDTPMLAPGVGDIMGAPLDPAPDAFKKDLLIHEAVRSLRSGWIEGGFRASNEHHSCLFSIVTRTLKGLDSCTC